jgi:DNA-binding MarR family transcriptional regulator
MEKLSELPQFQQEQNIVLEGFDPVSAGGFTQLPNILIRNKDLTANAKVVHSALLSYAWYNNAVFPEQETLAEEIGSTRSTVNRAIIELEDNGWLEIQRMGQGKKPICIS